MCVMAVFVGDAMAEIVGCIYGTHSFEVTGLGDINTKTYEGSTLSPTPQLFC